MSVLFYASSSKSGAHLSLSASQAIHLLVSLGIKPEKAAERGMLSPETVLPRLDAIRRQMALGRGREFTSTEVDLVQMVALLDEFQHVAESAWKSGTAIALSH